MASNSLDQTALLQEFVFQHLLVISESRQCVLQVRIQKFKGCTCDKKGKKQFGICYAPSYFKNHSALFLWHHKCFFVESIKTRYRQHAVRVGWHFWQCFHPVWAIVCSPLFLLYRNSKGRLYSQCTQGAPSVEVAAKFCKLPCVYFVQALSSYVTVINV